MKNVFSITVLLSILLCLSFVLGRESPDQKGYPVMGGISSQQPLTDEARALLSRIEEEIFAEITQFYPKNPNDGTNPMTFNLEYLEMATQVVAGKRYTVHARVNNDIVVHIDFIHQAWQDSVTFMSCFIDYTYE
ncbi:hypothetical protein PCE1_002293 [Barthelona sp. PCE]